MPPFLFRGRIAHRIIMVSTNLISNDRTCRCESVVPGLPLLPSPVSSYVQSCGFLSVHSSIWHTVHVYAGALESLTVILAEESAAKPKRTRQGDLEFLI